MNGIRLLVLQANLLLVFCSLCCSPLCLKPVYAQTTDPRTQYGWQINKEDGVLEYIIQASPFQIRQMQEIGANGRKQELQSDPPQWIVGRFGRIVLKIGEEQLPREGTREQIEARFPRMSDAADDIAAVLGNNGSFRDVEPPVVNVNQNGRELPYPQSNQSNLIDSINLPDSGRGSSASQRFLSDAQGGNGASGGLPATSQLPPATQYGQRTGKATNGLTGLDYGGSGTSTNGQGSGTADWRSQAAQSSRTGSDRAYQGNVPSLNVDSAFDLQGRNQRYPTTQSNLQDQRGNNVAAGTGMPSSRNIQGTTQAPFGSQSDQFNYGNQQAVTTQNNPQQNPALQNQGMYAGNPNLGNPNTGMPNVGRSNAGQPGFQAGSGNVAGNSGTSGRNGYIDYGNGVQQPTHLASNTLPSTGPGYGASLPTTGNSAGRSSEDEAITNAAARLLLQERIKADNEKKESGSSPSDVVKQNKAEDALSNQTARAAGPSERWLSVFILISLIVNFYLVVLLRKLLTRYRTLLSSVRSQTA